MHCITCALPDTAYRSAIANPAHYSARPARRFRWQRLDIFRLGQQSGHHRDQLLGLDRLGEKRGRAGGLGARVILCIGTASENDHRKVLKLRIGPQLLQERHPIHFGHAQIGDHEIDRFLRELL